MAQKREVKKGGRRKVMDLKGVTVSVRQQKDEVKRSGPTSSSKAGDDEVKIGVYGG